MSYISSTARVALYTEGQYGDYLKTALGVLRYARNPIVALVDSTKAGQTTESAFGIKSDVPMVGSLQEALAHKPEVLLLGAATPGGIMPPAWKKDILEALKAGMDIVNGLHNMLADDADIVAAAKQYNRKLWDVRQPPDVFPTGTGKALSTKAFTVLTVGTDAALGKMTTSLELDKAAIKAGFTSKFVATGQTGIMIDGAGVSIDRVIGDFMAGMTEKLVLEAGEQHEFVWVEGQGALSHPAWSGVTLALMHGACPHAMVLCHKPSRPKIIATEFPVPSLTKMIEASEMMASFVRPAKVVGIALNTSGLSETEAQQAVAAAKAETGLIATDPVRYGVEELFAEILKYREKECEKHTKQDECKSDRALV